MEIQSPTVADVSPESSRMLALLKNKNSLTPIPANEMIPAAEEINKLFCEKVFFSKKKISKKIIFGKKWTFWGKKLASLGLEMTVLGHFRHKILPLAQGIFYLAKTKNHFSPTPGLIVPLSLCSESELQTDNRSKFCSLEFFICPSCVRDDLSSLNNDLF